jgi:hypothetical protein
LQALGGRLRSAFHRNALQTRIPRSQAGAWERGGEGFGRCLVYCRASVSDASCAAFHRNALRT